MELTQSLIMLVASFAATFACATACKFNFNHGELLSVVE